MKRSLIYIGVAFVFLPAFARASTAVLMIDTGKENVNALEVTLVMPKNTSIDSVSTGSSMVLIWVDAPLIDATAHTLHFSGLTPGGFQGVHQVLSFTGNFSRADIAGISAKDVVALKNDGRGTGATVALTIVPGTDVPQDTVAPVPFGLSIGRTADLYGGRYIVTFLSQDKGTGVDYYEYASTYFFPPSEKDWRRAESPLVLRTRDLYKKIYVRAVDRAGNASLSTASGPYRSGAILCTLLACILYIVCVPSLRKRFLYSS